MTEAAAEPELMPHGYSHRTTRAGTVVTKSYQGPDSEARCAHEAAVLRSLAGQLPVAPILSAGPAVLQTMLMPGVHGQDLIARGMAEPVLAACGEMLRRIHELEVPSVLAGREGETAAFLVHGDFGPNNVLLDGRAQTVTAVLDWEWAHAGDPVEDLAWCEFIVRLHHAAEVAALGSFYDSYGSRPPWPRVKETILSRCQWLLELCQARQPAGAGAAVWRDRIATVRRWTA